MLRKNDLTRDGAEKHCLQRDYRVTAGTLARLASQGGGPIYFKVGGRAYYRPEDLDAWIASKTTAPLKRASEPASLTDFSFSTIWSALASAEAAAAKAAAAAATAAAEVASLRAAAQAAGALELASAKSKSPKANHKPVAVLVHPA